MMVASSEKLPQLKTAVVQVIGTFGGGGAQRLAFNLAHGLAELGMRSYAIALREGGIYSDTCDTKVKLFVLNAKAGDLLSNARAFFNLRALLKKERIEVVHVHGTSSLPFIVLATRCMQVCPRIVFTWQDSESVLDQSGWKKSLLIWALHRCDAVSGSSRLVAQKLQERARLPHVGVFHGGVPVCRMPSRKTSTASPMIIWLGRIVPPKDPQILIHAAAQLRDEGFQFSVCLIGKPIASTVWYLEETEALIEKLQLQDVVNLLGFLSDEELQEKMIQADISVQTSHTEGLSIALMEHMMSGLAIIATDVGDTAIAIEDGISGIIIPPKDIKRLTDALKNLLSNHTFRIQLASAAHNRAVESYSIHAMAQNALNEYSTQ